MYTINIFEIALLAQQVQIEEIKSTTTGVHEAIGYKDGKRMTWNSQGECFQNKVARPEFNLKLNN